MISAPCYKCQKRELYCHCDCAEYGAYADEREELREKRHKGVAQRMDFAAYREESICRTAGKPRRQR